MSAIKIIDFEAGQKLIDPQAKILWPEFEYEGTKYDLYGTCDYSGYTVEEVSIANLKIDVTALFLAAGKMEYLDGQCNAELPCAGEREQDARADHRERMRG